MPPFFSLSRLRERVGVRVSRLCQSCGTPIGRTIETCPQCGRFNRAERTIWVWLTGGLVVLILFLALGDLGLVLKIAGNLLAQIRAALSAAH